MRIRRRYGTKNRHPQISILMPFRADPRAPERVEIFHWVVEYWLAALPDAEIIVGRSRGAVFSKTEAVNNAARRARGRIFVILDSDAYLRPEVIQYAADAIDRAEHRGQHLWFIPYRHLYRLTKAAGRIVLDSDPQFPIQFPEPPSQGDVLNTHGSMHGHRFGALIQMMSRVAFYTVGGMDERFRGWGGEDVAFVRAVDTLYGPHKTTRNDILHIWHPTIGHNAKDRMWSGQKDANANMRLVSRYNLATGDPAKMRGLVDETKRKPWWKRLFNKPGLWVTLGVLGLVGILVATALLC